MKDIPMFTTEFGIASLALGEIPYRKQAFIRLRSVRSGRLAELLKECVSFCRLAGAEQILAQGDEGLQTWPLYAAVYEMRGQAWADPDKVRCLFPVTEATAARWRQLANERLRAVACAATVTASEDKRLASQPGAYFIHDGGQLLGLGLLEDTRLRLVCSARPGAGEEVMHSLMSLVEGSAMTLEVASTNSRAIHLYERLGFAVTGVRETWYRVYTEKSAPV